MNATPNPAAVALGSISTPIKAKTSRENGLLGGRPKGSKNRVKPVNYSDRFAAVIVWDGRRLHLERIL